MKLMLSKKKLAFLFPLSIFIMIFDRLRVYHNMSMYRALQMPILIIIVIFLLGQKKLKFNLYNLTPILLFGFLLSVLISTLPAVYQEPALIEARRIVELIILSFIIFFFIKNQWDEKSWVILAKMMMIAGGLSGLSVLTDLFGWTHFYRLYCEVMPYMRPIGILGESNYAAGKLGIFLPFTFFCIVNYRKTKKYFQSSLSIVSAFLIMIAMFFTGSRMGGFIAIFSILIFLIKEIRQKRLFLKIAIFFITLILIITFINLIIPIKINLSKEINYTLDSYKSLFHFLSQGEEIGKRQSLYYRRAMLLGGISIFLEHPFFGVGIGNYKYIIHKYIISIRGVTYSHNTFITVIAELGIIGLFFFLSLCLKIIYNIFYYYKHSIFKSFYFYLGLSFLNLLIMSFFLHNINDKYFWGMFVVISMFLDNKKYLINKSKNSKNF
jgi:O-antigen ligase